jgi:Cd2+/Zn2+-exporting ATPase
MTEHTHSEPLPGMKAPGQVGCCAPREVAEDAGFFARYGEIIGSLVAGLLLLAGYVGERLGMPRELSVGLYLGTYLLGGWELTFNWLRSAFRGKVEFNVDLLMVLAAIGAAILGNWAEGAFLLFLFALSHGLEHLASDRARHAIRALAKLTPDVATVLRGGRETELPITEVVLGDTVLVKPGERIPVDGTVSAGSSAVDQAPITGESVPVEKVAGSPVFAGTVNGDGALQVSNERAVGDRTLDRVVRLVEEAQTQKAPTERFADRFSAVFVPIVLVADVLLIVVPPLLGLLSWQASFYRGMVMLVGACPCALALGTPSAVLAGIAQAARHGVLVKGGAHLENLGNVRAVAFDKTGTLTRGEPSVTDIVPLEGSQEELLQVAAAVELRSAHPLGQAIVRHAASTLPLGGGQGGGAIPEAHDVQNVSGKGLRATIDGETVEVGSLRLFDSPPKEVVDAVDQLSGRSVVVVRFGARWLGVIGVADAPRTSARPTLDALRALGLKPLVMLTGDAQPVAAEVAKQIGVDEFRAELLPEDKVAAVRELLAQHGPVAMLGDGVNDAPALAHATVGIAMGGAGTAVALETADVALMADDLARLPFAIALARSASRTIRTNLFIALGVIVLLIVTTATGFMRIGPAVVLHEGSTLVVLANSLRLLRFRVSPDLG